MFHDETQPESHLERSTPLPLETAPPDADVQRKRMLIALGIQSIELVRDLVLGAAEYARQLGFAPHHDFQKARPHLGPWTGPSTITFGHNGKPTYISGPYDNPDHVLHTLRRAVGHKSFNYTIGADLSDLPLTLTG